MSVSPTPPPAPNKDGAMVKHMSPNYQTCTCVYMWCPSKFKGIIFKATELNNKYLFLCAHNLLEDFVYMYLQSHSYEMMCVCVCVCMHVQVCVCVCVHTCAYVCVVGLGMLIPKS